MIQLNYNITLNYEISVPFINGLKDCIEGFEKYETETDMSYATTGNMKLIGKKSFIFHGMIEETNKILYQITSLTKFVLFTHELKIFCVYFSLKFQLLLNLM